MSFAGKVKEELYRQTGRSRHCQIAELTALFTCCGQVLIENGVNYTIKFLTENLTVLKKSYILFKKAFRIAPDLSVRGSHQYLLYLLDDEEAQNCLEAMHILDDDGGLVSEGLLEKMCCKRAFLRGIFMACGSVTDPNSGYHLEMTLGSSRYAEQIREIIGVCGMEAKIVERKKMYVVYMKEGSAISDFLSLIGAPVSMMEFENVRILKDMRNSINRKVNCETANIKKTVSAATRQTNDIQYIHDTIGFGNLSDNLAQIAKLRLDNPDVTLKELGEMLEPPLGKSGVNHRLRRLSEIAENLRGKNQIGGNYD